MQGANLPLWRAATLSYSSCSLSLTLVNEDALLRAKAVMSLGLMCVLGGGAWGGTVALGA